MAVPEEITDDAGHIYDYLLTDIKDMEKNSIIADLNRVYFENRGFLTDYQLTQNELFAESDESEKIDDYTPKRLDITADTS